MTIEPKSSPLNPYNRIRDGRASGIKVIRGHPKLGQAIDWTDEALLSHLAVKGDRDEFAPSAAQFWKGPRSTRGEFSFSDAQNDVDRARLMSFTAAIKGGRGLFSGKASISRNEIETEREQKRVVYLDVSVVQDIPAGISFSLNPSTLETLKAINSRGDVNTVREDVLNLVGTHYTSAVRYGYSFFVRLEGTQKDQYSSADLNSSLNLSYCRFVDAKGSFSDHVRESIKDKSLLIQGRFFAANAPSEALYITTIDQLFDTLYKLRNGVDGGGGIAFEPAPIEIDISPLSPHIRNEAPELEHVLSVFTDQNLPPALGMFGVPRGTIIAWHPPEDWLDFSGETIEAPQGWALCNGENGTPDLREQFLRGTDGTTPPGAFGGSDLHQHKFSGSTESTTVNSDSIWGIGSPDWHKNAEHGQLTDRVHRHRVEIDAPETSNVPRFCSVIYLMRL